MWKCFTDVERIKQWWGPKGVKIVKAEMDLRPGGTYHYAMQTPDGKIMWGKFVYREIVPPERLVFINSFSDETGRRHAPSVGAELAAADAVDFHLRGCARRQDQVHRALVAATRPRAEEQKAFDAGHASMTQGWGGTLDQLAGYLTTAA